MLGNVRCIAVYSFLALLACSSQVPVPSEQSASSSEPANTPEPEQPDTAPEAVAAADTALAADAAPPAPDAALEPFRPTELPAGYLHFDGSCEPGAQVTIAAVGDLLIHRELQKQALEARNGFRNLWAPVGDLLAAADLTYANLEGPLAQGLDFRFREVPDPGKRFDNKVYTGYPRFNYHKSLARDLRRAGVDVVSLANNHAMDRGRVGLDQTIDALDEARLRHFGARRQNSDERWYRVTKKNGIAIAWVACTLYTNQDDDLDQVMHCYKKPDTVTPLVRRLAKRRRIDAVIVTPHIGKEYTPAPGKKERKLVRKLLDAGALAVIAAHPHVLRPWEKHVTPDGRETFAIYSLGNFCSHQRQLPRRSSMLLYLGLTKGEDGVTRVNGVRYVPLHVRMEGDNDKFFVESVDRALAARGPEGQESAKADDKDLPQSRALTVDMFGETNLLAPDEPLVTNPHCERDWDHHVR